MYSKPVENDELAAFGLLPEDFATEALIIWPENQPSYEMFAALSTQWRMGFNGPTGLDYNVLGELWRRLKVPVSDRDIVFSDIRIMESAALSQMSENQASRT